MGWVFAERKLTVGEKMGPSGNNARGPDGVPRDRDIHGLN